MNRLLLTALLFLAACSRKIQDKEFVSAKDAGHAVQGDPQVCSFGLSDYNLRKRPNLQIFSLDKKKPGTGPGSGNNNPAQPPSSSSTGGVILLDFDGHLVTNTSWNFTPSITCTPANLTFDAITEIAERKA